MQLEPSNKHTDADESAADQPTALHQRLIDAVIDEAHRAADGCAAFLKVIGWDTNRGSKDETCRLSLNLALKIGAMMRVHEWQEAGFGYCHSDAVTSAEEIYSDLANGRNRIRGTEVAKQVLALRIDRMAWERMPGCRGDVLIEAGNQENMIDQLAEFLWRHRHSECKREY